MTKTSEIKLEGIAVQIYKKTIQIILVILIVVLLLQFLIFLERANAILGYKYIIDGDSGYILNIAKRIYQGKSMYAPITTYPYLPNPYPPIYPALLSIFYRPDFISFVPGRIISFLAIIGIGFIIYGLVKQQTNGDALISFLSAFLFYSFLYINNFMPTCMPDMLATFLVLLGFYIAVHNINTKLFILPVLTFLLAINTKQSMFAPILSLLCYLFLVDKKRFGVNFVLFIIVFMGYFLLADLITKGNFFKNIIFYCSGEYSIRWLIAGLLYFLKYAFPLLIIAFAWIIMQLAKGKLGMPINLYFLFSFVITILLQGRVGSTVEYLIEISALSCVMVGCFLYHCKNATNFFPKSFLLFIASAVLICVFVARNYTPRVDYQMMDLLKNRDSLVIQIISQAPGPVVTEDGFYAVFSRKDITLNSVHHLAYLARKGIWDQSPVLSDIKKKKFSMVQLNSPLDMPNQFTQDRFTKEMLAEMQGNYRLAYQIYDIYLYVPK